MSPAVRLIAWPLLSLLWVCLACAGESEVSLRTSFDRTQLDAELSRPLVEVRQQGPEALRLHLEHLVELYAALEQAEGVSPEERRSLSDRILARVVQANLWVREGAGGAVSDPKARGGATHAAPVTTVGTAAGFFGENSLVVVGLVGGVIIAYALGRLAGYQRGASQASYYGAGDPRWLFIAHRREDKRPPEAPTVTLEQIREALASGRSVLLQLGYEIAPERRAEFLRLMGEMQRVLDEAEGHAHSVWEDPRHPNRFYEIVVCQRLEALDRLTADQGELARLETKIEACWLAGRSVVRRAWWGMLPEQGSDAVHLLISAASGYPREDRVP